MTSQEVKGYAVSYEDQRKLVESLGTTQFEPANKPALDVLDIKKRRLDATRIREISAMRNLTNYIIDDIIAVHAQAAASTTATIAPAVTATTPTTTSTA